MDQLIPAKKFKAIAAKLDDDDMIASGVDATPIVFWRTKKRGERLVQFQFNTADEEDVRFATLPDRRGSQKARR